MLNGSLCLIVSSWRFARWNRLYYSNKAWIKTCCFKYAISSGRLYSFEELYIWIDTWSDLSAPGCLKDSPTPQKLFLCWVLYVIQWCCSRSNHEDSQKRERTCCWKGKPEKGKLMLNGSLCLIVSSWRFVRWNRLYYSIKHELKSCCFKYAISSGRL